MTTYGIITELQNYLKSKIGLNVRIGLIDTAASELPVILIIPDEGGTITLPQHERMNTFDFGIKIRLLCDRTSENMIKNLKWFDALMEFINAFQEQAGHSLSDNFTCEYTDNNYEITVKYILKVRFQNS